MKKTSLWRAKTACSFVIALTATTSSFAALSPGDLQITEVMANPKAVSDTLGEWFEIYNTTSNSLSLNGLLLKDDGSNSHTIGDVTIAANQYFVMGRNNNPMENGGLAVDYVFSGFTLSNSTDQIQLIDDGVTIATLNYSGDFVVSGASRELINGEFLLSDSSMSYGDGDWGTPGSHPDQLSEVPVPAAAWLFASGLLGLAGRHRLKKATMPDSP